METTGNYKIPADPGNTQVGGGPLVDMPKPKQVGDGGQGIQAEGESHPDNPAKELGQGPHAIGKPSPRPQWNGDPSGPMAPASRPSGHPALR
jgi:hypothetical protein